MGVLRNARQEVKTPVGRIDILTPTDIYELKTYRQAKHAIGQLLSYSYFYPEHELNLVLFDVPEQANLVHLKAICRRLQIGLIVAEIIPRKSLTPKRA